MAETFTLKKGATLPSLVVEVTYIGGEDDLTGCSGFIKMRHQFGDEFSKAVVILDQGLFPKKIEVPWVQEDVDSFELGIYYAEYHITFPSGKLAIFPTEGAVTYDRINVLPSLSSVA